LARTWNAFSNHLPARTLRGIIAQSRRSILKPAFRPSPELWDRNTITAAWLGHSTVLINFYGLTVLTDPVLFRNAGADVLFGTIGPKRLVAPALTIRQLPRIDLVLLSHAHMDHFNCATLRCFPKSTRAVTARATADLLCGTRLRGAPELAWGQKKHVTTQHGEINVQAFEVKHWGARWRYDRHRGYNGYVLEREGKKIIFGGDTAWTESFRSLRSKGPFELAIMPIGAYEPWIQAHCTPEQAVQMANDAGAKYFLPIHFKTFALGREGTQQPLERLKGAIENERIGWTDVGQTFCVNRVPELAKAA
jgi:L-ascorbate metabolism protein UlaG (beta-lactamase superfamily)